MEEWWSRGVELRWRREGERVLFVVKVCLVGMCAACACLGACRNMSLSRLAQRE